MRILIVNEATTLKGLRARLARDTGATSAAIDELKSLNPHLDFAKISAGSVLFIPDAPAFRNADASSLGADAFTDFASQVRAGMDALGARARSTVDSQRADHAEVAGALKSRELRVLVNDDAGFKAAVEGAERTFKQDQDNAEAAAVGLKAMTKHVIAELDELAKILT